MVVEQNTSVSEFPELYELDVQNEVTENGFACCNEAAREPESTHADLGRTHEIWPPCDVQRLCPVPNHSPQWGRHIV